MALFGGLLGGGDDYDLYGDLLSDKQRAALRSREMTQGLLRMSGAFAEAAKPSYLPTGGIGSALGRGAAALAGGEGADKALQGLLTGEKIRQAQQERELYKRFGPAIEKIAWKLIGGQTVMAPPGQPPAPGAQPVAPVATTGPGAQQTISATAADAAIPADDAPMLPGAPPLNAIGVPLPQDLRRFGLPARPTPAGAAPAVDRYGMPAPPGYEFVPGGGMRALPQGAQQQQTGVLPQIASLYEGGSPEGSDPFGDGAPGAAGGGLLLDPERRVDVRPLSGQAAPASGAPSRDDPRGLIPYIRQQAIARGIDPDVAVRVAQSEGLGSFQSSVIQKSGRREPSFGAFQLYTGGGMGNEFQRDTGLDPSDPRNEKATIDYALDNVTRTGWTPWHGARGAGIGPRTGLPGGQQYSASSTLPDTGRVDVRPLSGAAVPAGAAAPGGAPGGKIPGTDVSPQELAALSMMLKMSGMKGSPFDALLETYYKSPEYLSTAKAAEATAEYGVKQKFEPELQADILRATQGPKIDLKRLEAEINDKSKQLEQDQALSNEIKLRLFNDGLAMEKMPDGSYKIIPLTEVQRTRTENERKKTEAVEGEKIIDVVVNGREMKMPAKTYREIFSGKGAPELDIPPMSSVKLGKPVYTPGQEAEQKGAAESRIKLVQGYREQADLSADAKTTLQGISAEIGNMVHGPFAPAAQLASSYLRIVDPGFNKQVSSYEELYSNANELVRKAVRQSDPNPSFIQTQMAMDAMPVPSRSPEGLAKITNRMIGVNDHNIARAAAIPYYQANVGNGSVEGFDSWWRKSVSPYAFVFSKMSPDDQVALVSRLNATGQGKREVEKLKAQLGFIKQYGLEQ